MKSSSFAWVVIGLFIAGCGGGGSSSSGSTKGETKQVAFAAHSTQAVGLGSITLQPSPATFAADASGSLQTSDTEALDFGLPAAAQGKFRPTTSFVLNLNSQLAAPLPVSCATPAGQPMVLLKQGDNFTIVPGTVASGAVNFSLTNDQIAAAKIANKQSLSGIWQAVIGYIGSGDDDTELAMKQLVNNPAAPDDTIVVGIHGIMCNYNDMTALVTTMTSALNCRTGYSLSYEWQDAVQNGTIPYLANWLSKQPYKKVVLIGDSFGCLVALVALQNQAVQPAVKDFLAIAGPNEGSNWATPGEILYGLAVHWINSVYSGLCPNVDCPAIEAMVPGSAFLTSLHTPPSGSLPNIGYYLFAGDLGGGVGDHVVGVRSALMLDVNLHAFTAGPVNRVVVPGEFHESIFRNKSSVDKIVQFYVNTSRTAPILSWMGGADGSDGPLAPDPTYGNWPWAIALKNNTNQTVTFDELPIETFRKSGKLELVNWYVPGVSAGGLYPTSYTPWTTQNTLQPGQVVVLYGVLWAAKDTPVWQVQNQEYQAFTMAAIVTYHLADGTSHTVEIKPHLVLHYGNIYPDGDVQINGLQRPLNSLPSMGVSSVQQVVSRGKASARILQKLKLP